MNWGLIYYNQNDFKNSLKYFDLAVANGYNKTNDFYENYGFAQFIQAMLKMASKL